MNILQRISKVGELPTLPEIIIKIESIRQSGEGSATLLSKVVERDPPLAAKILKIANSSFYCPSSQRISSVSLAITRIGFNEVSRIALAISLIRRFNRRGSIGDYKAFWQHSLQTAYLVPMIITESKIKISPDLQDHFFMAGLLHDIGILVMDQFFGEEFGLVMECMTTKEISYLQAEPIALGKENHAVVGAAMLELWKMNAWAISGVRFHHAPARASQNHLPIAGACYIAEWISNNCRQSFEGKSEEFDTAIGDALGIKPAIFERLLERVDAEVEHNSLTSIVDEPEDVVLKKV